MICVLFVDDDEVVLQTLCYTLGDHFNVILANNGEEALEMLCNEAIDVLVTDQRMPGMDGVEVCRRAREIKPEVPRAILTAFSDIKDITRAINDGRISVIMAKPYDRDALVKAIEGLAQEARPVTVAPPEKPSPSSIRTGTTRKVWWERIVDRMKSTAPPSAEQIAQKIDSDRLLVHAEVTGAIDCVLQRLDQTLGTGNNQVTEAAKRLSDESQRTQKRVSVPPSPTPEPST